MVENLQVWPFRPNWKEEVTEAIEFKTSVLTALTGAEQRSSVRPSPRWEYDYVFSVNGTDRAWCENMLRAAGSQYFWMPVWEEAVNIEIPQLAGTSVPVSNAKYRKYKVGQPIVFVDTSSCQRYDIKVVIEVGDDFVSYDSPTTTAFKSTVKVAPGIKTYLEPGSNGIQFLTYSDSLSQSPVKMFYCDTTNPDKTVTKNGPLIYNGLIVNSWARSLGRGGYFHQDSGTSEGQFIFLRAALKASTILSKGTPEELRASTWFRTLAYKMADAMGDGSATGPMLRQPVPTDPNTLCELHWLFAARGDIPERSIVYAYETTLRNGKIVIPQSARGGSVYNVVMIYPATSKLLYDGVSSPAYDIDNPSQPTQTTIKASDWAVAGLSTTVNIPETNDNGQSNSGITSWKIVYGYDDAAIIPITFGYEAYPDWTLIPSGYAACAPDTFRWFEAAMSDMATFDVRGSATKWQMLRTAMRRTCIKGQSIDDLRTVLTPMPGFAAIPASGDPTGMFCYSGHPNATTPSAAGANPAWLGYNFWSRDDQGRIVGSIPDVVLTVSQESVAQSVVDSFGSALSDEARKKLYESMMSDNSNLPSANTLYQSQIGRGFSDSWRQKETYQDADYYMYVEVSADRALETGEHILLFLSATQNYDPTSRWFAVLDQQSGWEPKTDGSTCKLFIPISQFNTRSDESVGSTTWGSPLSAGQTFQNYGLSVEVRKAINVTLGTLRPVSGESQAWVDNNRDEAVKGSKMPFFPGSLPFAINLSTKNQQFVGWNGSPFHGYQQPDFWLDCVEDAELIHSDLAAARDLPIPNDDGSLTFPISETDSDETTKPKASLLCEQQCYFLKKAQEHYHSDGGSLGPFAHTYVLNTPARSSLGDPTPGSWVYVNDDPNTRWIGYQTRPVESLARLVMLSENKAGWQTVHDMALAIVTNWLDWFNGAWTSSSQTIYTDYPDPRQSAPQANYDEPHGAALILRAALWLKSVGKLDYADALIVRLWDYLERIWAYNQGTPMAGTWSDNPNTEDWYGFWHGEIILTITTMLENPSLVPAAIDLEVVRKRLMDTYSWLRSYGVKNSNQCELDGFDNFNGYAVFPFTPDQNGEGTRTYSRKYQSLDNAISPPIWADTGDRQFETFQEKFALVGVKAKYKFAKFFIACRGQAIPFWYPTFCSDFEPYADIKQGDRTLKVKQCGFTTYVWPTQQFTHIMIMFDTGATECVEILGCEDAGDYETLLLSDAFLQSYSVNDISKISYLNLTRFGTDRIEISHLTDSEGVATVSTLLQSAPDIRVGSAAFYI